MPPTDHYVEKQPTRQEVDSSTGPVVVDFGTNWCGYCKASRGPVKEAMATHPDVRHLRVEDGRGRPLGRSFGVRLWPTLVFLRDGEEMARLVRPTDPGEISRALAAISSDAQS